MRGLKFFLSLVLLLPLLVSCSPTAIDYEQVSKDDKIVIRFSHVVGEDTPKGQAARMFAELIKERTQGQVEVQVFSNSSLYNDSEELGALQQGHVQIIAPALSKVHRLVPELAVFDLPYLYSDLKDYHQVLDGDVGMLITSSFEKQGYMPIAFWDGGFKQFTNNIRPIHSPLDLAKLTMRTMPSSVLDQQFTQLNVTPIEMNFDNVYLSLEKKVIDGQENTISNIFTKRFYRVQKYMTLSNHGYLGYVVLMDKKFWNELPAPIQEILLTTILEVTSWQREQALKIEQDQLTNIYNCECIEIEAISDEERANWRAFFKPLYQSMEARFGSDFFNKLQLSKISENNNDQ